MIKNCKRRLYSEQKNKSYDEWNWFIQLKEDIEPYKTKHIVFVSDCDGIMTDGRSYVGPKFDSAGKIAKAYGAYDKEAIMFATKYMQDDFKFVSGDANGQQITRRRIESIRTNLSIPANQMMFDVYGSKNRLELVRHLKNPKTYPNFLESPPIVVFIGDSLSDIPTLAAADIAMTVKNAPEEVKDYCDFISEYEGGHGALADLVFGYYNTYNPKKNNGNL